MIHLERCPELVLRHFQAVSNGNSLSKPFDREQLWTQRHQYNPIPSRFHFSSRYKKADIQSYMVEAAGVEPASENVTGQETTCLFQFMPSALPEDVRGPRSERTRNASR